MLLYTKDRDSIHLSEIKRKEYTLVLRYSTQCCSTCVEDILRKMRKFEEQYPDIDILLFTTYRVQIEKKDFQRICRFFPKVYNVFSLGIPLDEEVVPNLNLDILGFVDDPYKILSQSKALISPLFTGAGIKVKVIEALACGIPVIGTDIAFEGLPPLFNSFMLIAETPKDYIRCMECLNLNIDERIKTKEMFIKTYQSDSITNYIKRI